MWFPGSRREEDGIKDTISQVVREGRGDVVVRVHFFYEDEAFPESLDFLMVESEKKIEEIEKKKIWKDARKEKINLEENVREYWKEKKVEKKRWKRD